MDMAHAINDYDASKEHFETAIDTLDLEDAFIPRDLVLDEKQKAEITEKIKGLEEGEVLEYSLKAVEYLRLVYDSHCLDPHFSTQTTENIKQLFERYQKGDVTAARPLSVYYHVFTTNSMYPEVRSAVSNTDDPSLPVETFRSYFLGVLFAILFSAMNQFFSLRWPMVAMTAVVVQLLAYPCGKALSRWVPTRQFTIGRYRWSFNPKTSFNQKEHMIVTVMASVALSNIYAPYLFVTQISPEFFGQSWASDLKYQYLITLSLQFIGYGLAGLARSCLVYPSYCIWPSCLQTIVLNRCLHDDGSNRYKFKFFRTVFTRYRYFLTLMAAYFVWTIIGPGYVFSDTFESFNWMTWFKPDSKILVLITGGTNGLGLNPLPTFDWNRFGTDPFVTPFFITVNLFMGTLLVGVLLLLPMYIRNVWNTAHLPFNSNKPWDCFGQRYNISRILDGNGNFDLNLYGQYSKLYIPIGYLSVFTFYFASYSSAVITPMLNNHRQMLDGIKDTFRPKRREKILRDTDVHIRLMQEYPEVPQLVYALVFLGSFGMAFAALYIYVPEAPKWLLFFTTGLTILLALPIGIIMAITNNQITLNVLCEFIGGLAVSGNPLAMNMFKVYGYMTLAHTIQFTQQLKLGFYTKVPPRAMFRAQIIATLISVVVSLSVMNWQLQNIPNICQPDQKDKFTCVATYPFFTSSLVFGAIGPRRMFGSEGQYSNCLYGFLLGAVLSVVVFALSRWRFPQFRHVYPPVLLSGGTFFAPLNVGWLIPPLYIGFLFQRYIKHKHFDWWANCNYLTSSALTCGSAIALLLIYFALQYHDIELTWWGTTASSNVIADSVGIPWKSGEFCPAQSTLQ